MVFYVSLVMSPQCFTFSYACAFVSPHVLCSNHLACVVMSTSLSVSCFILKTGVSPCSLCFVLPSVASSFSFVSAVSLQVFPLPS